jgi:hypothetical protein
LYFFERIFFISLKETDLNKITDDKITIDWLVTHSPEDSGLREIINLRLRKSISELENHPDPWSVIFDATGWADRSVFEHILDRTYHRPRDIIQYCKECQKTAKMERIITLNYQL